MVDRSHPTPDAPGTDARSLTRRVGRGDAGAFEALYDIWFDRMLAWARSASGRDESFCLDVLQESFVRIISRIPVLENDSALGAWLKRVVTRCALDMLRQERRRLGREQSVARRKADSYEQQREDLDEHIQWLKTQLDSLPADDHRLVEARHRFGWTFAQIGTRFGLSTGAAAGRIRRSLSTLADTPGEALDE